MNLNRLKEIENIELCHGIGKFDEKKLCIMQCVDYVSSVVGRV